MAEVRIPETERRQNHIGRIDPNHTLLQVALLCLKDRDVERPSAQQLCERVAALKESAEYNESVRGARIKMKWREETKAPCKMSTSYNAVADDNAMYVRTRNQEVYAYLTSTSSWSQLPNSPNRNCPSVIVNNLLTLVGGDCHGGGGTTNLLFSLTREGSGRRWTEKFPPMPTKRWDSTALCTKSDLIVAGGVNEQNVSLKTVEMMNIETLQWSTAADLPQPLAGTPGAVCGDVYILALERDSKSMYLCPVSTLIQSCRSKPTVNMWN